MPAVSGTTVSGIRPDLTESYNNPFSGIFHKIRKSSFGIVMLLSTGPAMAGSYTSYNGGSGIDTPIAVSGITKWATTIADYSPAPGLGPNFRNPASGGAFSLGDLYSTTTPPTAGTEPNAFHAGSGAANFHPYGGDVNDTTDTYGFIGIDAPGSVTFYYETGIYNGAGADLAVRENGFASGPAPGFFAELAFVEVSSNGTDFARFPSISLNTTRVSTAGTFQMYDMTNVYNLAGKHASNLATPFDLEELATHSLVLGGTVNLANIKYVRLVDVVGNPESSGTAGALDSLGNRILDNWTTYDSGGFDISIVGGLPQAVGVLHAVPEPSTALLLCSAILPLMLRARRDRKA
ncbi:PEP-CTERM sorting domain-containing protein [Luteolibacter yonseiensis]|uniref:PEP-CTERM sorting domain-containing protein n=1 Tax=Luteolibacter yonseiensis TaxID=1144680 RepID=A0A934R7Q7_9BACT|nr:PEP-CTERM sorting domain-containing protein [Luteolibacter yonseiensis]MBK1816649.1 PEP-CTERM sorting domain-containing protein [Luteolibacter yonseiensis]